MENQARRPAKVTTLPTERTEEKRFTSIINRFSVRSVPSRRSLTALEHISPIAPQRGPQAHQCWKTGEVITGFNALDVTRTQARLLRQLFLSELPPDPQRRDIFPESHPMRTSSRLTLRHSSNPCGKENSATRCFTSCSFPAQTHLAMSEALHPGSGASLRQCTQIAATRTEKSNSENPISID